VVGTCDGTVEAAGASVPGMSVDADGPGDVKSETSGVVERSGTGGDIVAGVPPCWKRRYESVSWGSKADHTASCCSRRGR
jgi:hypothetical protein